ncbi:MAG: FAD:protein FMN transferase, partial [Saprospiraceae bacterium]|nr:FAD:protein FMN transferase [Saprospiraceae bacterium]
MPLINYWGFGYTEKKARSEIDSTAVEKMMKGVGLDKIIDSESFLYKPIPSSQLDFIAIAKGYAVDALAESLEEKGCKNYLVEVGREVYAKGLNVSGQKWKVGISTPSSEAAIDDISRVVELTDSGVASSGNYRNFYIVDGKKYGHTIDPHTGYPSLNDLLGTTVISKSCMRSDAYATAFLAMGLERASILVEELDEVEACFFYSNQEGTIIKKYSNGFIQYVAGSEK